MNKLITIKTAIKLDKQIRQEIIDSVEKKLKNPYLEFEFVVDSSLIGGILIIGDDFVLDGTIKAKLKSLDLAIDE